MYKYAVPAILLLFALGLYITGNSTTLVIIILIASGASFAYGQGAFKSITGLIKPSLVGLKGLAVIFIIFFVVFAVIFLVNPNLIYSIITPTSPSSSPTNTTGGSNATTAKGVWSEVDNVSGWVVIPAGERSTSLISFSGASKLNAIYKITFTRKWDFTDPGNWGNGDVTWSLIDPNNSTCWGITDWSPIDWTVANTNCNYVGTPFTLQIVNTYDARVTCEWYVTLFEWV